MPSEWWTYTLRDFLLFSPRTYYRLFELYNAAIWPAQIVALGLGLAIPALLRRPSAARGRVIAAILAGCWLWVAIAFHARRYATINTAAIAFAWGFGLQAALLLWIGIVRGRLSFESPAGLATRAGLGIFALRARRGTGHWTAARPRMAAGRDLRRGARPDGRRHARSPPARERPGALDAVHRPGHLVRDHRRHPARHEGAGRLDSSSGSRARDSPGDPADTGLTLRRRRSPAPPAEWCKSIRAGSMAGHIVGPL